jgi:hypothetical protein
LWSIHRWSYTQFKGFKTYTAVYNNYTKTYDFNGKRYTSYDDMVQDALQM